MDLLSSNQGLGQHPTDPQQHPVQIFFSSRCPLLPCNGLSPTMKWLYTNGTWAYFCNVFTTPTFILVPFISLMFGINPFLFSRAFGVAATLYLGSTFLIMNYFRWAQSAAWRRCIRHGKLVSLPYHCTACLPARPPHRKPDHAIGLWLANLSNSILCFTYFKAIFNTLLVSIGVKPESGFKVSRQAAALLV